MGDLTFYEVINTNSRKLAFCKYTMTRLQTGRPFPTHPAPHTFTPESTVSPEIPFSVGEGGLRWNILRYPCRSPIRTNPGTETKL